MSDDQRPAGTYARDILNRLLIDLSWSSSRLEGNTYSLLDTKELIEHGTAAPGKDAKETQMIFELLLTKAAAIRDPFEQSLFLMVQLPYLQPFVDVNERTSRLAANISLSRAISYRCRSSTYQGRSTLMA
jgi:Fic family protein